MKVEALDHVNIRSTDVGATIAFFEHILGMTASPPPGMDNTENSAWMLDDSGHPAIHVGPASHPYPTDSDFPFSGGNHSGAIHHVALRCQNPEEVRERLSRAGLAYKEKYVDIIKLRQIFVPEANGILLELNFYES